LLFIIGLVLVSIFALFAASILRLTFKVAYLLALYLFVWANVVLGGELLGLFQLLFPGSALGFEALLALAAVFAWLKCGKPSLLGPLKPAGLDFWRKFPALRDCPPLWLLGIGIGAVYLIGAVTILIVPPNNYDSMTYHLARVGYWIQHHSVLTWPTANLRQTSSPMNAELGLLWTIQLWGTDQLAGFVQWLAVPFAMAAIFGIARLMGARITQGIFAGLVWATFPEIIFQSTSAQNDLVTSAFFIIMVYLLALGMRSGDKKILLLSSLAMGLALGAKVTVPFMLPGMAVWLVMLWIQGGRKGFRSLLVWGLGSLAAFLLFGAFTYAQNILVYHTPVPIDEPEAGRESFSYSRKTLLFSNLVIYSYQALDLSCLPPVLADPLLTAKAQIFPLVFKKLGNPVGQAIQSKLMPSNVFNAGTPPSEDTAWFGPLAFLLLIPAGIYQAVQGLRRKDSLRLGLVLMAAGFWIMLSMLLFWSPYKGRYFVIAFTVLAPFAAFIYRPSRRLIPVLWIVAVSAVAIAGWTTLTNSSKPLVGPQTIWGKDAIQLRTIIYSPNEAIIRTVEGQVPPNATLAVKLGTNGWDYAFFGHQFQRSLVQVDPFYSRAGFASLGDLKFDYLLVGPRLRTFLNPPEGLRLVAEVDNYQLYSRVTAANSTDPSSLTPIPFDSKHLIEIKPPLVGTAGVLETWSDSDKWDIEQYGGDSFYWLGEGESEALGFSIWTEKTVDTHILLDVAPGPGRTDSHRTLAFAVIDRNNIRTTMVRTIDGPAQLQFPVTLLAGYNVFRVKCEDFATILVQPNGDARPLMALLKHITILPSEGP
jgi:Dolichyl-phosphate-mannose-protein mannosyltransferase